VAGKTGQAHHGDSACGGESGVWAVVAEVAERPADGDGWGATFAVVCAGSWFALHRAQVRRHQPAAAEKLLAQAYTQKRTLELRMAGAVADYAPIRVSRGAGGRLRIVRKNCSTRKR